MITITPKTNLKILCIDYTGTTRAKHLVKYLQNQGITAIQTCIGDLHPLNQKGVQSFLKKIQSCNLILTVDSLTTQGIKNYFANNPKILRIMPPIQTLNIPEINEKQDLILTQYQLAQLFQQQIKIK